MNFLECSTDCLKCKEDFCITCEIGYINNNGICEKIGCPSNCVLCDSETTCLTCEDQYYWNGEICAG